MPIAVMLWLYTLCEEGWLVVFVAPLVLAATLWFVWKGMVLIETLYALARIRSSEQDDKDSQRCCS